ncbi:MAG: hypothetical protein V4813_04205 [Gemmatimonadota bacterium]
MKRLAAGPWLMVCGVLVLAACADDPTGVPLPLDPSPTFGSCGSEALAQVISATVSNPLPVWTVRATFSGAALGLPFNLSQSMNFPSYVNVGPAPCLNTSDATYSTEASSAEMDPIPAPPGVDADWWASLSPREQRVLIKWAEILMKLNPNRYTAVGNTITQFFEKAILEFKAKAKIRANDFYGGTVKAELLSGGIYGCMLYRRFAFDQYSPFSWAETMEMAADLVTAFGEAQFTTRPLAGLVFSTNGVFGAGLAAANLSNGECGRMVFDAVGSGRISVTDPYGSWYNPGSANPLLPPSDGGDNDR